MDFFFSFNFLVSFGMAFLVGTFVVLPIKERVTQSKHLQYVSGVHTVTYWLSSFFWDFINYLIPAGLLLVIFGAFGVEAFVINGNLG